MSRLLRLERVLEAVLFGSRWLLAPFCLGLAISLIVLLCNFAWATVDLFLHGIQGSQDHLIIAVLGLIDVSLMANLVLIVILPATRTSSAAWTSTTTRIARRGWGMLGSAS